MTNTEKEAIAAEFSERRLNGVKTFKEVEALRTFNTGATRNTDNNKFDYEGFFSPAVIKCRAEYMHTHRLQADGHLRDSDNWQKGIPEDQYMKSLLRHVIDLWAMHRGMKVVDKDTGEYATQEDLLCAIAFNADGKLFERLKANNAHECCGGCNAA